MRTVLQHSAFASPVAHHPRRWLGIVCLLLAGLWLSGCDKPGADLTITNKGNVSVNGNEGRLVGHGRMVVGADTVEVRGSRVFINGTDYGPVNENAEVYYRTNGSFRLLTVNGEERSPYQR